MKKMMKSKIEAEARWDSPVEAGGTLSVKRSRWAPVLLVVLASFILLVSPSPCLAEVPQALRPTPNGKELLTRVFDNLYDCDLKMVLRVELFDSRGDSSVRRAEIARKRIRGRTHSYGRFLAPPWMRDTTMLMIDHLDRPDDFFLFLPESKKLRRMTNVQRTDAFLGSDLWFEDLERRYPEDYEVIEIKKGEEQGESVYFVRARSIHSSDFYREVRLSVAESDHYLLGTRYYRGDSEEPFREVISDRANLVDQDGHRIPTRYVVTNHDRSTRSIASFTKLSINPHLEDRLFRSVALETGRKVPGLTD
jgi:hypothetical protein